MRKPSQLSVGRGGLTLMELLAALIIVGVLATTVIPRLGQGSSVAKVESCAVQREVIQIQAGIWLREKGKWPKQNLRDIGEDPSFFPEGLPTCPVDGKDYKIDKKTGLVVGHDH